MVYPIYEDQTYLDLVEEILLENQSYVYVKPQYRLLYCVLSSAYIIHSQHAVLEKISQTAEGQEMIKKMASEIERGEANPIPTVPAEVKVMDNHFMSKYKDLL